MASSSADAHSQPKRPLAPNMARQPSASSQLSQSPSDGHGPPRPAPPKSQRQHVVGQSRVQRTASGKNLPKLNKLSQAHGDGSTARHHRRAPSANSNSAPSSPRPGFKRNASAGAAVRATHAPHPHTAIRKNHSSGHLARHGGSKTMLKSSRSEIAPPKRSLGQPGRAQGNSPDAHPTVHFDVEDEHGDEEHDDGWTEASASQSPTTTRSNTRSNSVVLEPQKAAEAVDDEESATETLQGVTNESRTQSPSHIEHAPAHAHARALPDRPRNGRQANGGSHHRSRLPDADMITSRLLRRTSSHNPPPQMSAIAATVVSDSHDARVLSQSAGSTLVDTPGRDLVSRFMDGDGSAGTPRGSSRFLPAHGSPQSAAGDFDKLKRNKSMPNVADAESSSRAQSRRSGTTTPTDLPPSRTQQKLMLQRASSNIEPQKLVPAILPRATGTATLLHSGITFAVNGEGRLDPRLQQQFNHVAVEYKVVRRYRDPLSDAIVRIQQIPGVTQRTRVPKPTRTNGTANVHGNSSLSTSFNESNVETDGSSSRRARVSFEDVDGNVDEADMEGRQSYGSANERIRNEAEEVCRRLWESTEALEGD